MSASRSGNIDAPLFSFQLSSLATPIFHEVSAQFSRLGSPGEVSLPFLGSSHLGKVPLLLFKPGLESSELVQTPGLDEGSDVNELRMGAIQDHLVFLCNLHAAFNVESVAELGYFDLELGQSIQSFDSTNCGFVSGSICEGSRWEEG